MYYTSFRIQNFKGIKDTTIKLSAQSKVGVFAFVGLNESGKTTILEAIHSFSPDSATSELVGGKGEQGVPFRDRVPRHLISSFTGDVSVTATAKLTEQEKQNIAACLKDEKQLIIDIESMPDEISFERYQSFENGDFSQDQFTLRTNIRAKRSNQKKWRDPNDEELCLIRDEIYNHTPDIAYFPTFVFNFPKRIFLTKERGDKISNFYRETFQDILDYDGKGHTIEESIIRRVRSKEKKVAWPEFLRIWNASDDKDKIQHVMDRASATVTKVVFGRWNEIFGEDTKGKEINISFETLQGEKRDQTGQITQTNEHDVFVKFQIKDGTRRFDVNDRSLGFRWFFAFMMFTQFRVARENSRPILFLFDEPASNLHAAAQQKLIESFPEVARDNHTLAYTTHSHYMIEPKWLEQTFIVTNRADGPNVSVIDALSLSDESLDIKATPYRTFVSEHPNQTNYFQPVLDRLQVVPSKFDINRSSIIVEGKSDYYVLRYAARLLGKADLPLIPGLGAGTFRALVALHLGWGLRMLFLLDGDKKGKDERERYVNDYGLQESSGLTLDEVVSGATVIEDLLDAEARTIISSELGLSSSPSKSQISRFFQECLARDKVPALGSEFEKKATTALDILQQRLNQA
jgi:ABC-type Na+ transport system ATPase subunit NatA